MQLLKHNHFSGVFFKQNGSIIRQIEQLVIQAKGRFFVLKTFPQNIADVVTRCFKERADMQRWMTAQQSDKLTRFARMGKAF